MRQLFYLFLFVILISACSRKKTDQSNYKNKEVYDISLGDSCAVYYSANSCCYYCIYNEKYLDNVKKINQLVMNQGQGDCEGCNGISSFVFKGIKAGVDTVKLKNIAVSENCQDDSSDVEKYIIRVNK